MPKTIDGEPVIESVWQEAKEAAAEQGQAENFALITTIYKRMISGKSETKQDREYKKKKEYKSIGPLDYI